MVLDGHLCSPSISRYVIETDQSELLPPVVFLVLLWECISCQALAIAIVYQTSHLRMVP